MMPAAPAGEAESAMIAMRPLKRNHHVESAAQDRDRRAGEEDKEGGRMIQVILANEIGII
jgi:hypothetical protein